VVALSLQYDNILGMKTRARWDLRRCGFRLGWYFVFYPAIFLTSAEGSPLRTGLWVTAKMPKSESELNALVKAVEANSNLSGVCLHVGWNEVEKEAGKFDFSSVDKTVTALRKIDRKYELSFKPGATTPSYIYQEGGKAFETLANNLHRQNFGQKLIIPIPWDPIYQRYFSRLIEEAGKRYSADPLCLSIVLTCANFQSAEMHLPKRPEDRAKWAAVGFDQGKLLGVYTKYIDEWAGAFPKQAISLHLAKVLDLPDSFNEQVIEYGLKKYPERFTIQGDQLSGRKDDTSVMTYRLVQKYADRLHHGFQSAGAFTRGGERMGSMEMAALNMVHAKAEYWELWNGDGLDPKVSAEVANTWKAAKEAGYDNYKEKLMASGNYRERAQDNYRQKVKGRRKAAQSED
jgi:hypothetical protein